MPEAIIDHCKYYLDNMGVKRPLLPENKEMFEKTSRRMGEKGLRPILLAYTQVEVETSQTDIT
jgi:magnesium-transporting ATPase (P-type)